MVMRWSVGAVGLAMALLVGCASMKVTKVPVGSRDTKADECIKGFRYYLSRPYVLVKEPIPVSTDTMLLILPKNKVHNGLEAYRGDVELLARHPGSNEKSAKDFVDRVGTQIEKIVSQSKSIEGTDRSRDAILALPARDTIQPGIGRRLDSSSPALALSAGNGNIEMAQDAIQNNEANKGRAVQSPGGGGGATQGGQPQPTDPGTTQPSLGKKMKIVFLPDMEEQYAVHNCNVLSKSAYALTFKDGWQLVGVNGDFDATQVALELLKVIDAAVDSAKSLAVAGLSAGGKAGAKPGTKSREELTESARALESRELIFEVTRNRVIPPGLYRINKPWEMDGGPAPSGCALLEKMGLSMVETVSVRLAPLRPYSSTPPPAGCPPCSPPATDPSKKK
jgi:hypothetical protein